MLFSVTILLYLQIIDYYIAKKYNCKVDDAEHTPCATLPLLEALEVMTSDSVCNLSE